MDKKNEVSYVVFESIMARAERTIERLWILAIILVVLFVGSNAGWLYYESQFEDTTTAITQELQSESGNAVINDGVHINGENKTDDNR